MGQIKQLLGGVPEQLALARQQVRNEVFAELNRCEDSPLSLDDVAETVHGKLRPRSRSSSATSRTW